MPHIRLGDKEFELSVGELRIGTGDDAGVRLDAGPETETLAIITVDSRGAAAVRRTAASTTVLVNGVALGAEPTPLLHGDRIEVAGRQLRFSDDRKAGSTVLMPALGAPAVTAAALARGAAVASGGRLVSLTDGREYTVPADGLRIGRDAGCDIVVPGSDVSRQHAELSLATRGYVLRDLSANGVFVNAQRTGDAQVLRRGDVIRIGTEEFRFYADHEPARATSGDVTVRSDGARAVSAPAPDTGRTDVIAGRNVPGRQQAPAARPTAAGRRAAPTEPPEAPRSASGLVWIAAALVIGATLFFVIQDR